MSSLQGKDHFYTSDPKKYNEFFTSNVWFKDPWYFKTVHISSLSFLKIVMHACKGGDNEIMGMLRGRIAEHAYIITDAFPLPVEGNEYRVNEHDDPEADAFQGAYTDLSKSLGSEEELMGWYHSHPGLNCWMSGIDCNTQLRFQQGSGCQLGVAIVVDHIKTVTSRHVEIGAFRTFPYDFKPPETYRVDYKNVGNEENQTDYGVNYRRYYKLDVDIYRSSTDSLLLNAIQSRTWVNTLSYSNLAENSGYFDHQTDQLAAKSREKKQDNKRGDGVPALTEEDVLNDAKILLSENITAISTELTKHSLFKDK